MLVWDSPRGGVSWSVAFSTTQNPGNLAAAAWYFNRWISWVDQGGEAANEGYMWWGHPTAYPGYVDVVFAGAGSPVPDLTLSNGTATTVRVTCNASDADTVDDKLYRMGGKYTTVADIQIYGTLIHTWTGNHGSVYYDDTFKEGWPHYYGVVRTSNVAPTTQAACSPSLYSVPHKHFTGGEMRAEGSHFFTAASLLGCAANYGGDWTFASNGDGTYTYKNLAGAQYADAFSTWAAMDRLHDFRLEVKAKSNSWGGDLGLIFPYASEGYYRRIDFGGFKTSAN